MLSALKMYGDAGFLFLVINQGAMFFQDLEEVLKNRVSLGNLLFSIHIVLP